jgi:hypothetical protein
MSMDAVSHMLILFWTKYFIRSCLLSYLIKTTGKNIGFEAIDVFVLESGEYVWVIRVSCIDFEVISILT